jgi:hypothetical protein
MAVLLSALGETALLRFLLDDWGTLSCYSGRGKRSLVPRDLYNAVLDSSKLLYFCVGWWQDVIWPAHAEFVLCTEIYATLTLASCGAGGGRVGRRTALCSDGIRR